MEDSFSYDEELGRRARRKKKRNSRLKKKLQKPKAI